MPRSVVNTAIRQALSRFRRSLSTGSTPLEYISAHLRDSIQDPAIPALPECFASPRGFAAQSGLEKNPLPPIDAHKAIHLREAPTIPPDGHEEPSEEEPTDEEYGNPGYDAHAPDDENGHEQEHGDD